MNELAEILSAACEPPWRDGVLATLVSVEGSSYRRPGARMLVRRDGRTLGTLSGGCLEADVRENCFEWTRGGPVLKTFDIRGDSEALLGWGSGCNGTIGVLLEPVAAKSDTFRAMRACLARRKKFALATLFATHGNFEAPLGSTLLLNHDDIVGELPKPLRNAVAQDAHAALACGHSRNFTYETLSGGASILVEIIEPAISLLLFGSGPDAPPVARFAAQLGWNVTVIDKRPAEIVRPIFSESVRVAELEPGCVPADLIDEQTVAVVMSHNYLDDVAIVSGLLKTPVRYVGLLGGRARSRKITEEILRNNPAAKPGRLYSPIGLDIGALDPQEIAISIIAEIVSVLRGRSGGSLRDRVGAMHFDSHPIARQLSVESEAATAAPAFVLSARLKW